MPRYGWVKKRFEGPKWWPVPPGTGHRLQPGHLYGVWPDGEAFEGNRYVDRYVIRHGLIVQMDVWNDSAERLLVRAGLAEL
jgi:hypothetical protein